MEWRENEEEVQTATEYYCSGKEQAEQSNEYFPISKEYNEFAKEYFESEFVNSKSVDKKSQNSRLHLKKKRKMGYLVAAIVAVATVVKSGTSDFADVIYNNTTIEEEQNQDISMESIANNIYDSYNLIDVSEYDSCSSSNAGVLAVKKNGLWGLINKNGEVILEPMYKGLWTPTNDNGYTVFNDEQGFYIVDKEGKEVFSWTDDIETVETVEISDDENIIFVCQIDYDIGEIAKYTYLTLDGSVIYESLWDEVGMHTYRPGHAFNEGKAFFTMSDIYELSKDGTVVRVQDLYQSIYADEDTDEEEADTIAVTDNDGNVYIIDGGGNSSGGIDLPPNVPKCYYVPDGYADGYYIGGDYFPSEDGYLVNWISLIDAETGEGTGCLNVQAAVDEYFENEDYFGLKSYLKDGMYLRHYQTYGCFTSDNTDILFDFRDTDSSSGALSKVIAVYDEIYFDNYQYIGVKDGEEYYYIDYSGNIVAGPYLDVSSFTENGYAMVIEKTGSAYVLNSELKKVKSFEGVTFVTSGNEYLGFDMNGRTYLYFVE